MPRSEKNFASGCPNGLRTPGSIVWRVAAASALADLLEISAHVEVAAIVDDEGTVVAATRDDESAERLARAGNDLLREAGERLGGTPAQLEAALREGSVFVHCGGGLAIVARTRPGPPSELVLHDLASCLARA